MNIADEHAMLLQNELWMYATLDKLYAFLGKFV